jgi:hypothetical protein
MNFDLPEEITTKLREYFEKLLKEYYGDNVHWTSYGLKGFPTYHLKVLKDIPSWPNSDDPKIKELKTKVIDKQYTISFLVHKEEE